MREVIGYCVLVTIFSFAGVFIATRIIALEHQSRNIRVLGFVPIEDRAQSFVARIAPANETEQQEQIRWVVLQVDKDELAVGGDRDAPALAIFTSRTGRWVKVTVETIPPPEP